MSGSIAAPWRSSKSIGAGRSVMSPSPSGLNPEPSTTGSRRTSGTTTRPPSPTASARGAPACGPKGLSADFGRPWPGRPRTSATPRWTGRSPCSGSIWRSTAAGRPRTIRSAGRSDGSATSGSGLGTSSNRTPSWRKKRRIRHTVHRLPPRTVLLAEDETDLLLFPPLRAGWAPRGGPKEVRLSGRNARRVAFGCLNLRTGTRLLLVRRRQRAGDFQAFLDLLHGHYRGWHVALLLDEDPSHTAAGSRRAAERSGIELIWLPKRAPELNPMDHLWGHGKDEISANKQYESIDGHVGRFIRYLRDLSSAEALEKAGVHSDDFWLSSVL
jgi:hypothetical protein